VCKRVCTARDAEDVALEVIAEHIALHLVRHALLVQVTELGLIVNLNELLASRGREGDIELHALQSKV
jgi:hypothetical protein